MTQQGKPLPDGNHWAGDDGCGPLYVTVKTSGGFGGDPAYAGGFIVGHTGHSASMMSEEQMRRLAAALLAAADKIRESGLPSYQQLRERKRGSHDPNR